MMYQNVYFIGIGGIGMSALARYFKKQGCNVCGYDRTETPLTQSLCAEGIAVHFTDDILAVPASFREDPDTLVVYTPAIKASAHSELQWFAERKYRLMKRSEVLEMISRNKKTIAVAGTHGKTSVSTMIAHLLTAAGVGCDAFLGGISKNYHSNLLLAEESEYVVAEADEYDRSFLQLHPHIAVVTAMDADHLDIYGTHEAMKEAFAQFTRQIAAGGALIARHGLPPLSVADGVYTYSYSLNCHDADFYAENIRLDGDRYIFDMKLPHKTIRDIRVGVPGLVNVENSVAAIAAAHLAGAEKMCMDTFEGVRRRFDYRVHTREAIYIDDYAHHPEELRFTIESVRELYPQRHITGIFQPHLYSRTRDFADEFAQSLSLLDSVILLEIYPAREEPIEGVTSKIIFDKIDMEDKCLCCKEQTVGVLRTRALDVWITLGAGDIDTLAAPIECLVRRKIEEKASQTPMDESTV